MKSTPRYSLLAKILHWGFVIFFIIGVLKAVEDVEQLKDASFLKFEVIFASCFLLTLLLRFIYVRKTQKSSLPENTTKAQKMAAKLVHFGMYFTLAVIASTGLVIGVIVWLGVDASVLTTVLIFIHELGMPLMYGLITLHVSAAIWHRFLNDGVWSSMVPFWKED